MALGPLEISNGVFSIIIAIIFALVGLQIMLVYRKRKDRIYLFMGLTWLLLGEPWWGSAFSFIVALYNNGQGLTIGIYFLLSISLIPFTSMILVVCTTDILFKNKQRIIFLFFLIFEVVFAIIFIYLFLLDPNKLGVMATPVNCDYSLIVLIYILISLMIFLVLGSLISFSSFKSDNPEIILRGKFLILAIFLYVGGAILDASVDFTAVTILIPRLIVTTSALCSYIGFVMPKFIKKIFLKQKTDD